jgi:elongation factor 3
MVVSHEPAFLDKICTDIIQYREMKMCYYKGNFTSFREQAGISDADCADILDGGPAAEKTGTAGGGDDSDDEVLVGYGTGARSKISFPIPMKLTGVSASKPILETKNLAFGYIESEPPIFHEVNLKVTQTSRIALTGRNGSGKSTLLALVAGELNARVGDVLRHRNLRIAYIPQNQLFYLSDFNELTPQAYIQARYKSGYDELVQTRLLQFKDEEDRQKRIELAKKYGKQGAMVRTIVGRTVKGKDILYEVAWEGLPDEKQNTQEPFSKLKQMGAEGEARAFDERNSVLSNSQDIRPVTRREIIKHFELFGLDEDMICNRQIGGFSAGQKSKLMLASSMWTRPQAILLDEPTNYVDVETLDAIARALRTFRGGLIISSRDQSFLDKVCTETWLVDGGCVTSSKRETYNAGD